MVCASHALPNSDTAQQRRQMSSLIYAMDSEAEHVYKLMVFPMMGGNQGNPIELTCCTNLRHISYLKKMLCMNVQSFINGFKALVNE